MRKKVAVSSMCLLLLVGCSSAADVTAGDSDNNGRIDVDQGQILDIVLPDDYTTSNTQWHDEQAYDSAILRFLGSKYEPERTTPAGTGSGTFTGRYKAVAPGTVHVTLVQEDNFNPPHIARRYALDVTVS